MELHSSIPNNSSVLERETWRFLAQELAVWFSLNQRKLPWRERRSPYATLVSELMLQQTTMVTAVPKFILFMKRFPSFLSLARASEEDVVQAWEGLGYYNRARRLHGIAQRVVGELNGVFPSERDALLEFKGIGPYTAAAVASLAFKQAVGLVDGNVLRVLSRLLGWKHREDKKFQQVAQAWVLEAPDPGNHNEALMELGALVCTPRAPRCDVCPLRSHCVAFEEGQPELYPLPEKRPEQIPTFRVMVLAQADDVWFFRRIPEGELCQGQWSPWVSVAFSPQMKKEVFCLEEGLHWLSSETRFHPMTVRFLGELPHSVFNERMRVAVLHAQGKISGKQKPSETWRWARFAERPRPEHTLSRKAFSLLQRT